jgi:hypothetical protein
MEGLSVLAPSLNAEQIQEGVRRRLRKYEDKSMLERFALFMGVAQLLELSLKALLLRKYSVALEDSERWTLGRTMRELKDRGIRSDFLVFLDGVVGYRNYVAHELLADEALRHSILGTDHAVREPKELSKGIYELEQLALLHDWCEEHDAWTSTP